MDTLPAREIKHRICAYFTAKGWAALDEFTLPNKRRLDVCAIGPHGSIIGVETKVSEGDLRQDEKFTDYIQYTDKLYFAIPSGLPAQFVHENIGLIISDAGKTHITRPSPINFMHMRERLLILSLFASVASKRIMQSSDYIAYHNADRQEQTTEIFIDAVTKPSIRNNENQP
jgi:hypothetical protein